MVRQALFDIGAPELLLLVVVAVILFGPEKLPELARKAARVIRYVRILAGNAQQQISQELGTDVDFRDLNPKAFLQKHLLEDVEPLVAEVRKEITVAATLGEEAAQDLTDTIEAATNDSSSPGQGSTSQRVLTPFDPEAT